MKSTTLLALAILFAAFQFASAKDENGLRLEARKTILENDDDRTGGWNDRIDRKLGLKVIVKNTSFKPLPAGLLQWIIVVERHNYSSDRYRRYTASQPFPALKPGEELNFSVGEVPVKGWRSSNDRYQDKIEAWSIVITHEGKNTITTDSGSNYNKINASAKDASGDSAD